MFELPLSITALFIYFSVEYTSLGADALKPVQMTVCRSFKEFASPSNISSLRSKVLYSTQLAESMIGIFGDEAAPPSNFLEASKVAILNLKSLSKAPLLSSVIVNSGGKSANEA